MPYINRLGLILAASLALLFTSAIAAPQRTARVAVRSAEVRQSLAPAVTAAQTRALDRAVAQLPPSHVSQATPGGTRPQLIPSPTPSVVRMPGLRIPRINTLEYVPITPAQDRQVVASLVNQPAIQQAITAAGAAVTPDAVAPLPGILRQTDASGNVIQLKAFALRGRPLTYDAARHLYWGTIILGVTEIVAGQPQRMLNVPVVFQVLDADSAEPAEVRFDRTSPPFQTVRLALSAARPVQVLSDAIPDGRVNVLLPLSPALTIEAGHGTIEGLGLEATEINISLAGVDQPRGRVVTLHTDSGYLDRSRVQLDDQGLASVTIRSGSVGTAHITASTIGIERAATDVEFRLPFITFLASLIGGIAGGFLRARAKGRVATLIAAAVCGMIVFALYAVGINVLPVSPTVTVGAVVVFVISALGGFWGPKLLRR